MDLSELPHHAFRRHPWELARARFFLKILSGSGALQRSRAVLDAGAGDAFFSDSLRALLPPESQITCWDASYTDAQLHALPAARPERTTFTRERPRGRFDLLLLLDVLEHVDDDRRFLGALIEDNLAPGALALVSVPAWRSLYSRHDRRLRHFRRYAPAEATAVLRGAGLTLLSTGGAFHSLLPVRAAVLGKEWVLGTLEPEPSGPATELGAWSHGPLLSRLVDGALRLDNLLSQTFARARLDVPGLSWWALCQKPS